MWSQSRALFAAGGRTLRARIAARRLRLALSSALAGRDCFVLGSAPQPDLSLHHNGMALVCVNGSAANAIRLGLSAPTLTVVDYELIDRKVAFSKPGRSEVVSGRMLEGLSLGTLLATQSNDSSGGQPEILGAAFERVFYADKETCRIIVNSVTATTLLERDVHGLTSRGALAIAICLWLGARSVAFAGFSLYKQLQKKPPNFYDVNCQRISASLTAREDTRSHTMADLALISLLSLRGFQVRTCERDFLPAVRNWGADPPDWAKRPFER